jgi:hypothetical protein
MECTEVQKRLSAYIEKAVSPKQKALIEAHLKGCRKCKHALADLRKTIKCVQKLPEVEPPAWLVQKVMARVRAEAEARQGIWQRFFSPFHIKLPLEAIALIFIVVGTVYIFKAMQPGMRIVEAPIETKKMTPRPMAPAKEKPPVVAKQRPAPARSEDQLMYDKRVAVREEKAVETTQAPASMGKQEAAAPAAGAAYKDALGRRGLVSTQEVTSKEMAKSKGKGKEVRFVVHVGDLATASSAIERIMRQLGGKAIKKEPLEDKAVIAVELDARKIDDFLNQLRRIGEVQGKGLAWEEGEGAVDVRVEVETITNKP